MERRAGCVCAACAAREHARVRVCVGVGAGRGGGRRGGTGRSGRDIRYGTREANTKQSHTQGEDQEERAGRLRSELEAARAELQARRRGGGRGRPEKEAVSLTHAVRVSRLSPLPRLLLALVRLRALFSASLICPPPPLSLLLSLFLPPSRSYTHTYT